MLHQWLLEFFWGGAYWLLTVVKQKDNKAMLTLVFISLKLQVFIFRKEMLQYFPLSSLNHLHFCVFSLFFHSLSLILAVYCKNKGDSEEDEQGIHLQLKPVRMSGCWLQSFASQMHTKSRHLRGG